MNAFAFSILWQVGMMTILSVTTSSPILLSRNTFALFLSVGSD